MKEKIRWGILGTGKIAKRFAQGVGVLCDAEVVAVGSRAAETGEEFGKAFDIDRRYDSYEKLANDPEVDVVYVATPHTLHMENTILCLKAGKPVLCEKPFAVNAGQARQMVEVARNQKVFLMEGMWTRFLPLIGKARQWLDEGLIGEVRMIYADFGFTGEWEPQHRILNPQLAGGALLDVGIYTVSIASMIFGGPPARVTGLAHLGQTGVDEQSAFILAYEKGQLAVLSCAVKTETPQETVIAGTKGRIKIHSQSWCPTVATITRPSGEDEVVEIPLRGNGFDYEAEEVGRCIRAGKFESDVMPLDETLSIMETMDEIRGQWGLKYPME